MAATGGTTGPGAAPPLGVGLQVSYGLGSAAFGIGGVALSGSLLQLYFNQVIGLPAIWVGTAIMVTIIIDAVADPLIGLYSDRLRSPFGRRHTLMYASALPAALGCYLMWSPPHGLSSVGLLAFMIAMLVFVRLALSLYEIPSIALTPELAPDYSQRSSLLAYRWLFLILGGAAINVVLYQVFLRQDAANPLGVLNRARWVEFGLTCAITIFVTILISTAATHSRIKHLHTPAGGRSLRETLAEIRVAVTHRPLAMIMLGGLMMGFGAGTTAGLAAYFSLHFWGLKPQDLAYLTGAGLVSSFVALRVGPWLGGRFGKKQTILALYVAWLLTVTAPIVLRLFGLMPPNGSVLLLVILTGNAMLSLGFALCCHINLGSCVADSIDDISVKTGRRSEGMMFAAYGLLDKCAGGGGAFVAGAILTAVSFPVKAAAGTVDPHILRQLALVQLPIVLVFNLASIFFFTRYSLTRADHERNAATLAARRVDEGLIASTGPELALAMEPEAG